MRSQLYTIILVSFFSCCDSNFTNQKKELVIDSISEELLNQIKESSIPHLLTDSTEFQEFVSIHNTELVVFIDDNIKILSIPIQGHPVRNDYILFVASDKKLFSSIRVNGNWIDNDELGFAEDFRFLSKPLIYIEDITTDGFPELIIKDRMHNGNLYNAATKHIFGLNNMHIKYIGGFEYISHLPVEDEFMVRHWNIQSNTVSVYLKNKLHSADSIIVGTYKIDIKTDTLYHYDIKVVSEDFKGKEDLLPSLGMAEYW